MNIWLVCRGIIPPLIFSFALNALYYRIHVHLACLMRQCPLIDNFRFALKAPYCRSRKNEALLSLFPQDSSKTGLSKI